MANNSRRTSPKTDGDDDSQLKGYIRELTLFTNPDGFQLASGRKSTFIFNLKNLYGHPQASNLITDKLLDALQPLDFDFIAGLELGAVFPVTCAILKSQTRERPVQGFVIRKAAKTHGTGNRIEGQKTPLPEGSRVVMMDDVTTTGNSLLDGVEAIRRQGCKVTHAVTLIDREEGAAAALMAHGIILIALFKKSDFLGPDAK